MTDTDPRLEAVAKALMKEWERQNSVRFGLYNAAQDFLAMYDALRAFDQARVECMSCEMPEYCPKFGCIKSAHQPQPESEVAPHRPEQSVSAGPSEHNATAPVMGADPPLAWPAPTPEMLASPLFAAIWRVIRDWDIAVPGAYGGYCGATGNHVRAILDRITARTEIAFVNSQPPSADECRAAARILVGRVFDHEGNGIDLAERLGREVLIAAAKARSGA